MGDASDNVPGVKGVGPKGALSLIQQYGTIDGVLEHASEVIPELAPAYLCLCSLFKSCVAKSEQIICSRSRILAASTRSH